MMSSWKKVKTSGAFKEAMQKERKAMLRRAHEIFFESRKKAAVRRVISNARPAVIINNNQLVISNHHQHIVPQEVSTSTPANNIHSECTSNYSELGVWCFSMFCYFIFDTRM